MRFLIRSGSAFSLRMNRMKKWNMSLLHTIVNKTLMKGRAAYDPDNPGRPGQPQHRAERNPAGRRRTERRFTQSKHLPAAVRWSVFRMGRRSPSARVSMCSKKMLNTDVYDGAEGTGRL